MKSAKKKRSVRKAKPQAELPVETSCQPETMASVAPALAEVPVAQTAAVDTAINLPSGLLLPASCTLRDAAALKTALLEQLDNAEPVSVDVSAVERVDTAALQVLTVFVRERVKRGAAIEWRGLNAVFLQAVHLLGLTAQLGIPAEAGVA